MHLLQHSATAQKVLLLQTTWSVIKGFEVAVLFDRSGLHLQKHYII